MSIVKLKNPGFPQCDHCRRLELNWKEKEPLRFALPEPFSNFRSRYLFPQIQICIECRAHPAYDESYWKAWLDKIETGNVITKAYEVTCDVVGPYGTYIGERKVIAVAESHDRAGRAAGIIFYKLLGASLAIKEIKRSMYI